jgi:hypothetical protein
LLDYCGCRNLLLHLELLLQLTPPDRVDQDRVLKDRGRIMQGARRRLLSAQKT